MTFHDPPRMPANRSCLRGAITTQLRRHAVRISAWSGFFYCRFQQPISPKTEVMRTYASDARLWPFRHGRRRTRRSPGGTPGGSGSVSVRKPVRRGRHCPRAADRSTSATETGGGTSRRLHRHLRHHAAGAEQGPARADPRRAARGRHSPGTGAHPGRHGDAPAEHARRENRDARAGDCGDLSCRGPPRHQNGRAHPGRDDPAGHPRLDRQPLRAALGSRSRRASSNRT